MFSNRRTAGNGSTPHDYAPNQDTFGLERLRAPHKPPQVQEEHLRLLDGLIALGTIYGCYNAFLQPSTESERRSSLLHRIVTYAATLEMPLYLSNLDEIPSLCKARLLKEAERYELQLSDQEQDDILTYYSLYRNFTEHVCLPPQFLATFFAPEDIREVFPTLADKDGILRIDLGVKAEIANLADIAATTVGADSSLGAMLRSAVHYYHSLRYHHTGRTRLLKEEQVEKFLREQHALNERARQNSRIKTPASKNKSPGLNFSRPEIRLTIPHCSKILETSAQVKCLLDSIGVKLSNKLSEMYRSGMKSAPQGSVVYVTDLAGCTPYISNTGGRKVSPLVTAASNSAATHILKVGFLPAMFEERLTSRLIREERVMDGPFHEFNRDVRRFFSHSFSFLHKHLSQHLPPYFGCSLPFFPENSDKILRVPAGDGDFALTLSQEADCVRMDAIKLVKLLLYEAGNGEEIPGLEFLKHQRLFLMAARIPEAVFGGALKVGGFCSPLDGIVQPYIHIPGMSFLIKSLKDAKVSITNSFFIRLPTHLAEQQSLIERFSIRPIESYSPQELYRTRSGLNIPKDLVPDMLTASLRQESAPLVNFIGEVEVSPHNSTGLSDLAKQELSVMGDILEIAERYTEPVTSFCEPHVIKFGAVQARITASEPDTSDVRDLDPVALLQERLAAFVQRRNSDPDAAQVKLTTAAIRTSAQATTIETVCAPRGLQMLLGSAQSFFALAELYKKRRTDQQKQRISYPRREEESDSRSSSGSSRRFGSLEVKGQPLFSSVGQPLGKLYQHGIGASFSGWRAVGKIASRGNY